MFVTRVLLAFRPKMPPQKAKYAVSLKKQAKLAEKLGFKGPDQMRMAFGIHGNQRWWRGFYWTSRYKWAELKAYRIWKTADSTNVFYSNAMDACIEFRTTNRVRDDIDHLGGIDNYLLTTRFRLGPRALATKKMIAERVEELKARGEWKPFRGLKDCPDFPTSFVKQLKLDFFVREALKKQQATVVVNDEYAEAIKTIVPPCIQLLPHEVDGQKLLIE